MSVLNRLSKRRRTRLLQQQQQQQSARKEEDSDDYEPHEEGASTPEIREAIAFIPTVEYQAKMQSFFHIGNRAKECLLRGYNFGIWHLECFTKSDRINVYSMGEANPDLKQVKGGVGIRENFGALSLTQAWQTTGYLGMIGVCKEAFGAIVHAVFRGTHGPPDNASTKVDLLAGFERPPIKSELIIPMWKSPKFLGYILVQPLQHFVFACRMEFNVENREMETHAFAVGYNDGDTEYGLKLENFQNVRGSVFQRLNNKWSLALKANLYGQDEKKFMIGGQYQLDEGALLKARISDDGLAGLVYQFKVNDNIDGNYYIGFDSNAPLKGEHKIGICWRFKG